MAPTLRTARAANPDTSSLPPNGLLQHAHLRLSSPLLATRAAADAPAAVFERAPTTTSLIPAIYGSTQSGLSAGVIVGITLGSVGGFLFLMALLYTIVNFGSGRGLFIGSASVVETSSSFGGDSSFVSRREDRRARRHRHSSRHASRRRRSTRRETVEIRGSRVRPVVVEPPRGARGARVVVEEERIRRTVGGRPGPSVVETVDSDDDEIVVEEEESDRRRQRPRVESDDEVVVIEDDSSVPTRGGSRRARNSRTGTRR